jgi:hypothetical protein
VWPVVCAWRRGLPAKARPSMKEKWKSNRRPSMVRMNFGKTWRHLARFMSLPLVAVLGGCNYDLSNYLLLTPKGPIALDERNLILLSLFLMLLVVVPVIIMTFVFAR